MTEVGHSIIRASAGSGKTYELVRRMVRLLALGVKPEQIIALTFTRKAAGEFFARLLQTLANLAEDPKDASSYLPELAKDTRAQCVRLLRSVIENMDRLRLGTLDSFFAAMVQSLPFELGLSGVGVIMSDHEKKQARGEALDAVLVDLMRPGNETLRREVMESWKLATFGSDDNAPARELERWFESLHAIYLDAPDETLWGAAEKVWTDPMDAVKVMDEDVAAATARLQDVFDPAIFKHKSAEKKWTDFYRVLPEHVPGTTPHKEIDYMLNPERGDKIRLREGSGDWKMWKTVTLGINASKALYSLLAMLVGRELRIVCQRTRGKNRLLGTYESTHRRLVRGLGRLAFEDLALLLTGRLNPGATEDWKERWELMRQDLDFRLNAKYDHWLFDEFQDTSVRQWRVFQTLVEEVLQDPGGQRTFFAVGDLKQSVYVWREAEPELFLSVEAKHQAVLKPQSLHVSWRSSPDVLGMVNDFFGNTAALNQAIPGAMKWWKFEPHQASQRTRKLTGHAVMMEVEEEAEKDKAMVAVLRYAQPRERNLTCAVLTRTNDEAQRIASLLRRELNCDVVCESEEPVATDNVVGLLLMSLIQLAAHPQDLYAWRHACMTPLSLWMQKEGVHAGRVGDETRREILHRGFLGAAELWTKRLREVFPQLDAFGSWRLRQFLEMCAQFDESGSRDVDAFLEFARAHRVAAAGSTSALQVMTIHKSKGLEFDLVILPELKDRSWARLRNTTAPLVSRGADGETHWVLDRPNSTWMEWDGRLLPKLEELKARAAFEALCLLYVAMTRAKQGLYLIGHAGKAEEPCDVTLLRAVLGQDQKGDAYDLPGGMSASVVYERGERTWFEQYEFVAESPAEVPVQPAPEKTLGVLLRQANQPVQRRTPSGEESFRLKGSELLSPQRDASRRMGTLVHALFEAVEWLDESATNDEEHLAAIWKSRSLEQQANFKEAAERVSRALKDKAVRKYFVKGDASGVAWMEQRFDLLLDKEWISGTLDRVVLERDAKGVCTGATIVDFKTDNVADLAAARKSSEGYAPQMKLYREAVERLTGLRAEKVSVALVFVTGPWVVESV